MKRIAIVGGGFSGTMTAVHLIQHAELALKIIIISDQESFNKGIAFNPYSRQHLLNVPTSKMSAFADQPDHFLDWVIHREELDNHERQIIAGAFIPRYLYGDYLCAIWKDALALARKKGIEITELNDKVVSVESEEDQITIAVGSSKLVVNACVLATGNMLPRNPIIKSSNFFSSKNYFQNPWKVDSVKTSDHSSPVLIVGNGLTMVDTVIGLLEHGFKGDIFSISPNGFNILPHRHGGLAYRGLVEQLPENLNLYDLVKLFNKHIKHVRSMGISAEPIIDSLRTHTQRIWRGLTLEEKKIFMARLRHLWGVARHRIPLHIHDRLQQLRIDGRLHIISGRINDLVENGKSIGVLYYDKKKKADQTLTVQRVINCTGPETNLMNLKGSFLRQCFVNGIVDQDELKLGIRTDPNTFEVVGKDGTNNSRLFTLGSNLKGELWETTAVNELRVQAERLAKNLVERILETSPYLS